MPHNFDYDLHENSRGVGRKGNNKRKGYARQGSSTNLNRMTSEKLDNEELVLGLHSGGVHKVEISRDGKLVHFESRTGLSFSKNSLGFLTNVGLTKGGMIERVENSGELLRWRSKGGLSFSRLSLSYLTKLNLGNTGLKEFLGSGVLSCLTNLVELNMQSNFILSISEDSMEALVNIGKLKHLELSLQKEPPRDRGQRRPNPNKLVPKNIGKLKSLRYLGLAGNSITELPIELFSLDTLEEGEEPFQLEIKGNKLKDQETIERGGLRIMRVIHEMKSYKPLDQYDLYLYDVINNKNNNSSSFPGSGRRGGNGTVNSNSIGKSLSKQRLKLLVLGHEHMGKSKLIEQLISSSFQKYKSVKTDTTTTGEVLSRTPAATTAVLPHDGEDNGEEEEEDVEMNSEDEAEAAEVAEANLRANETVGVKIHRWHPNKKKLNEHWRRFSSTKTEKEQNPKCLMQALPDEDDTTKFVVWDFAGQAVYHAVNEIFFSEHALHLIAWDVRRNEAAELDTYVQFWIDLIQARVPGATILIAATHIDLFREEKKQSGEDPTKAVDDVLKALCRQLQSNESSRKRSLDHEIELCTAMDSSASPERLPELKMLREKRPRVNQRIIPLCNLDTNDGGVVMLTHEIIKMTTRNSSDIKFINETKEDLKSRPHFFDEVQSDLCANSKAYYEDVKSHICTLRSKKCRFLSVKELHKSLAEKLLKVRQDPIYLEWTEKAVQYWVNVGEIMYGAATAGEEGEEQEDRGGGETSSSSGSNNIAVKHIFLQPQWLVRALNCVLDHRFLRKDIETKETLQLSADAFAQAQARFSKAKQIIANGGIVDWKAFIEDFFARQSEDYMSMLPSLKSIMIAYDIIIPITFTGSLETASSSSSSSSPRVSSPLPAAAYGNVYTPPATPSPTPQAPHLSTYISGTATAATTTATDVGAAGGRGRGPSAGGAGGVNTPPRIEHGRSKSISSSSPGSVHNSGGNNKRGAFSPVWAPGIGAGAGAGAGAGPVAKETMRSVSSVDPTHTTKPNNGAHSANSTDRNSINHLRADSAPLLSSQGAAGDPYRGQQEKKGATATAAAAADDDEYFLIPAFVPPYTEADMRLPFGEDNHEHQHNASGYVVLERVFTFNRFAPPGLVHRIFATMYSLTNEKPSLQVVPRGQQHQQRQINDTSESAVNINRCWDRAFRLLHKVKHSDPNIPSSSTVCMLVFLESSHLLPTDSSISEYTSIPQTPQVQGSGGGVSSTGISNPTGCTFTRLVIKCRGHLFNSKSMLEQLDNYCSITEKVLEAYPGLRGRELTTTCPTCLENMSYHNHAQLSSTADPAKRAAAWRARMNCGKFRQSSLIELEEQYEQKSKELTERFKNNAEKYFDGATTGGAATGTETAPIQDRQRSINEFIELHRHKMRCSKSCSVMAEKLIKIPQNLMDELTRRAKAEHKTRFLLDSVVRSSAVPTQDIKDCAVKVMLCSVAQRKYRPLLRKLRNDPTLSQEEIERNDLSNNLITFRGYELGSGAFVDFFPDEDNPREDSISQHTNSVSTVKDSYIMTCDHIMTGTRFVKTAGNLEFYSKYLVLDPNIYGYGRQEPKEFIFLVGDATHWLYAAEIIVKGSDHSESVQNFWDVCVLRIVGAIKPIEIIPGFDFDVEFLKPGETVTGVDEGVSGDRVGGGGASASGSCIRSNSTRNSVSLYRRRSLLHPAHAQQLGTRPIKSVQISALHAREGQEVRLISYPGLVCYHHAMISVGWGRVRHDGIDVLINLHSDSGSSGGPILDRTGKLLGVLARSHEVGVVGCMQKLFFKNRQGNIVQMSDLIQQANDRSENLFDPDTTARKDTDNH